MSSHRILYVGRDHTLLQSLQDALKDCRIVRSPSGRDARFLIESEINYSLLLFDEELSDTTGLELAHLARGARHRERTPIIILSASEARCVGAGVFLEKPDDLKLLVSAIKQLLAEAPNAEG